MQQSWRPSQQWSQPSDAFGCSGDGGCVPPDAKRPKTSLPAPPAPPGGGGGVGDGFPEWSAGGYKGGGNYWKGAKGCKGGKGKFEDSPSFNSFAGKGGKATTGKVVLPQGMSGGVESFGGGGGALPPPSAKAPSAADAGGVPGMAMPPAGSGAAPVQFGSGPDMAMGGAPLGGPPRPTPAVGPPGSAPAIRPPPVPTGGALSWPSGGFSGPAAGSEGVCGVPAVAPPAVSSSAGMAMPGVPCTLPASGGSLLPLPVSVPAPGLGLTTPAVSAGAVAAAPTVAQAPVTPARPVFLAPATASIVPASSKPARNKQIALEFLKATTEKQTEMLKDPNVARAILQTLAESPAQGGGQLPQMASLLGGALGATVTADLQTKAPVGQPTSPIPCATRTPEWTGSVTLARNMGKRMPARASLLHGRVQDVEVALRSAASNQNVLDVTHRVPFDDVARRVVSGTVLALAAQSRMDIPALDEYIKYFRSKMRAGVVRLGESYSMYILPPAEDVPTLRDSLYSLGGHIPRMGCLIGVIAQGSAVPPPKGAEVKTKTGATGTQQAAATPAAAAAGTVTTSTVPTPGPAGVATNPEVTSSVASAERGNVAQSGGPSPADAGAVNEAAEDASRAAGPKDDGGVSFDSKELLDLFSNPELIKFLSDDAEDAKGK